jgi:hypothetical protein
MIAMKSRRRWRLVTQRRKLKVMKITVMMMI